MKRLVIMCSLDGGELHYWTGTGLSSDSARAARFETLKEARAEWREHKAAFPGWKAQVESL